MNDSPLPADSAQNSASSNSATSRTTIPFSPMADEPAGAVAETASVATPGDDEPLHEWMASVLTADGWRALGVSLRGFDHEDANAHRDDAAALAVVGPWLICAAADGVGSAKMSRFGARAAANAAVASIAENMRLLPQPADESQLVSVMNIGMMAALSAMQAVAEQRKRRLSDFSTTLLLVIHGHDAQGTQLVVTAQVGDGALAAFAPGGEQPGELAFVQLGTPDEGHAGGEIIPFNGLKPALWPKRIHVRALPAETVGVLLLTDGVSDAFKPWYRHLWRLMTFLREHVIPVPSTDEALAQLRATISFERPGMGDDRTIILIQRPS